MWNEAKLGDHPRAIVPTPYDAGGCTHGDDLYFVSSANGFCKIGRTGNMRSRFATLQNASPDRLTVELVLPGMGWQERVWHAAFRHLRVRGEWFSCSPDLGRAINAAEHGDEWIATLTSQRAGVSDHQWRDRFADMEEAALRPLNGLAGQWKTFPAAMCLSRESARG